MKKLSLVCICLCGWFCLCFADDFPAGLHDQINLPLTEQLTHPFSNHLRASAGETKQPNPLLLLAVCQPQSFAGQLPFLPSENWNAYESGDSTGVFLWDDYSAAAPISRIRFWGFTVNSNTLAPCTQNPKTFQLSFHPDVAGNPGAPLFTYNLSLSGTDGDMYDSYPIQQYEAVLSPPCSLTNGWLCIQGTGSSSCAFFWPTSADGNGSCRYTQGGGGVQTLALDFSWCLGVCEKPRELTVDKQTANLRLRFIADAVGKYYIYSRPNADGNLPAVLIDSVNVAVPDTIDWLSSSPLQPYQNYTVRYVCP